MDDSTATQLELIAEVSELLTRAEIPHWLFGGWSVDFHAGEVTCEHGDIEFFIRERDRERAGSVMRAAGYGLVEHPHPEEAAIWRKHDQIVELYLLVSVGSGEVAVPGRWENWGMPESYLEGTIRELRGVRCPVVSVECILSTKLGYEEYTGIPSRDRDVADIEVLRRIEEATSRSPDSPP